MRGKADIRPLDELTAQIYDRYGASGFNGRYLVASATEGRAHTGIELRRYYYGSAGGPGGGGSSGGGY